MIMTNTNNNNDDNCELISQCFPISRANIYRSVGTSDYVVVVLSRNSKQYFKEIWLKESLQLISHDERN